MKRSGVLFGVLSILASVFGIAAIVLYDQREYQSARLAAAAYPSTEEGFVDQAIDRWSAFNREPREEIQRARLPVVIAFDLRTCVQLKTIPGRHGGLGGSPIYCFDNQTGELVYEQTAVD